ncbi:MAG TPA: DUF6064 family protein [Chitinophagaceae bacterium]|jgi:hypothetical protein|nr:DUF6064 family protein [Chitinophagaceae bacterium]
MQKIKALAILNAISFILHLGIVYMTQNKMLNTKDVGEVSDQFTSFFTPADFTFAIWGIIYTCLGIFCLYHIVMAYKHQKVNPANVDLVAIGPWFIFTNLASAAWLWAWTNEQLLLSVALIFVQLLSLIIIHARLGIHMPLRSAGSKTCTEFPLSIYFGWISIATVANTATYLVSIGWDGAGIPAVTWTMIALAVIISLTVLMVMLRKNIAFGLVAMWGLYGIVYRLTGFDTNEYQDLINIAWGGIALIMLLCLLQVGRSIIARSKRRGVLDIRRGKTFPESAQPVK